MLLNAAPDHPFFCHDHIHALVIRLRRELMKDLELVCQGNGLMTVYGNAALFYVSSRLRT